MSGLIVGLVLRTPITDEFNSDAKFIATVYADHAWEDGTHAYPAVGTVAAITGLSERTVQRYCRVLEGIGMLIPDGKGPRGTNKYRFPLVSGDDGSVRLAIGGGDTVTPPSKQEPADSGDSLSPRQPDGGDRESGDRESGDTIVSPKQTNRHLKPYEEEGQPAPKFEISDELQEELKNLGVFVSVWKDVERQLSVGWGEKDIVALIDWMLKTRSEKTQAARGFVTRVREGTKAPQEYYAFRDRLMLGKWVPGAQGEPEYVPDELEPTPETSIDEFVVDGEIARTWTRVQSQLQAEMPRASYENWVRDTQPIEFDGDVMRVAARNDYARDWLESRLSSTVERMLVGIMNQYVTVEFVSVETAGIHAGQ